MRLGRLPPPSELGGVERHDGLLLPLLPGLEDLGLVLLQLLLGRRLELLLALTLGFGRPFSRVLDWAERNLAYGLPVLAPSKMARN